MFDTTSRRSADHRDDSAWCGGAPVFINTGWTPCGRRELSSGAFRRKLELTGTMRSTARHPQSTHQPATDAQRLTANVETDAHGADDLDGPARSSNNVISAAGSMCCSDSTARLAARGDGDTRSTAASHDVLTSGTH